MKHDIFIFGSLVRGEVDQSSDCDVLVIPEGSAERNAYPKNWSVYHRQTVKSFFEQGRLFAWHLHLEARCIFSSQKQNWLEILGSPQPYQEAAEDVESLMELLNDSLIALKRGSNSEIYELGICYTAIRDIAMSVSWSQLRKPSFSRDAPYLLPVPVPLHYNFYEKAMQARHFSTRGGANPEDIDATVNALLKAPLLLWAKSMKESV
ncbi:nucleotidyltransferase domain-containing protein [Janthinobacterium lividum]|uniref:nucleotidyltransferase domain-containing protein n=1 Tax=Janthinobacterium lividum TaxID=29581 RepID=UPI000ADC242D|nr:nucleotidyltransferase domain-containing protein [Janthinobacterium lividum]